MTQQRPPDPARAVGRGLVDGVPVVWVEPSGDRPPVSLALWITHLGGSKEQTIPVLQQFADAGHVAVSLDPWQHGQRSTETRDRLTARVFGDFRRQMWPILGQTTLDCLRLLDWAQARFGGAPVVAGGVSMGGDIAVTLAGIDTRVGRVAAIVGTPDWTRPGMTVLDRPDQLLAQGSADSYARWFHQQLDPFTHLDRYARGPAITFECGQDDTHVPADGAIRFRDALLDRHPEAGSRVRVRLHPDAGHLDGARDPRITRAALDWLRTDIPVTEPGTPVTGR